jgi:hypothetical protein
MKTIIGLSCVLIATACGTTDGAMADPDPDPGAMDPDQASDPGPTAQDEPVRSVMPAPELQMYGSTKITATTTSAGPALQFRGGTDVASYGKASWWSATSAPTVTGEFTVNPAPGASFIYELMGTNAGWGRNLKVQRIPGSDTLQTLARTGTVVCGPLPSGQPTVVTLSFDTAAGTYDVLIAGAPSACMDLPAGVRAPINGVRIEDSGNAGYGGQVDFTNLGYF